MLLDPLLHESVRRLLLRIPGAFGSPVSGIVHKRHVSVVTPVFSAFERLALHDRRLPCCTSRALFATDACQPLYPD